MGNGQVTDSNHNHAPSIGRWRIPSLSLSHVAMGQVVGMMNRWDSDMEFNL